MDSHLAFIYRGDRSLIIFKGRIGVPLATCCDFLCDEVEKSGNFVGKFGCILHDAERPKIMLESTEKDLRGDT